MHENETVMNIYVQFLFLSQKFKILMAKSTDLQESKSTDLQKTKSTDLQELESIDLQFQIWIWPFKSSDPKDVLWFILNNIFNQITYQMTF